MRKIVSIAAILMIAWCPPAFPADAQNAEPGTSADDAATESADTGPDYRDWYQIEVILFARRATPESDEIWPEADMHYPADMAAISPHDDADLKPYSLSQLEELVGSQSPVADQRTGVAGAPSDTDYLFESKSRFSQNPTLLARGTSTAASSGADETVLASLDVYFNNHLPQAFRALDAGHMTMNDVVRSLKLSSYYRVLDHLAWRQPLPVDGPDIPVMIQAGDRYDSLYEVDGTLTVSRARYLHVDTNFWFTEFVPKEQQGYIHDETTLETNLDQAILDKYPQLVAWAKHKDDYLPVHIHPLIQSRRMRSGEIHYLDHPFFGVLIKVDEFDYEGEPQN